MKRSLVLGDHTSGRRRGKEGGREEGRKGGREGGREGFETKRKGVRAGTYVLLS